MNPVFYNHRADSAFLPITVNLSIPENLSPLHICCMLPETLWHRCPGQDPERGCIAGKSESENSNPPAFHRACFISHYSTPKSRKIPRKDNSHGGCFTKAREPDCFKTDLNQASLPWSISQAIRDEQGLPVRSTDTVKSGESLQGPCCEMHPPTSTDCLRYGGNLTP